MMFCFWQFIVWVEAIISTKMLELLTSGPNSKQNKPQKGINLKIGMCGLSACTKNITCVYSSSQV